MARYSRVRIILSVTGILSLTACAIVFIVGNGDFTLRRSPRLDLLRALGSLRPVPGRISGLAYATYPTTIKGTFSPKRLSQLYIDLRRINQELRKTPQATILADLALLRLAYGDSAAALQSLTEATRLAPGDGILQSDLCALLLEQANHGSPEAFFDALTAAYIAVGLVPEYPPARFNLALALEENGLRELARSAWKDYLRRDPGTRWSIEARRHLALAGKPDDARLWEKLNPGVADAVARGDMALILRLSRRFPSETGKYAEAMLDRWAEAFSHGDRKSAESALAMARSLGHSAALTRRVSMTSDAVAVLDRFDVVATEGQARILRLAKAQNDLAAGEQLCLNQGNGGPARLELSRETFAEFGSPLEYQAIYFLAVCSYEHAHYSEAIARLLSLLDRRGAVRYPDLMGKANSIIGMCYLASGRPDLSLRAYETADRVFELSGATNEVGYTAYLLSENLRYLGERRAALRLLRIAVAVAVKSGDARALYRAFDGLAEEASRRGSLRVALDFRHQVLRVAQRAAGRSHLQEAGLAHALLREGEARLALGDVAGARGDLFAAARYVAQISDVDARRLREADLLLAQGRLLLTMEPQGALRLLTVAVQEKLRAQSLFFLLEALYTRAQAEIALGDRAAAAEDLSIGLREFERQRGEVVSLALRTTYLERMGQLFDLAIELAAEKPSGSATALALAERERARSLLDLTRSPKGAVTKKDEELDWATADHSTATKPLSVDNILRRLPDRTAVVEYATLPDRLLIWLLRHGNASTLVECRIGAEKVRALVSRFRQSLERRESESDSEVWGAALYEVLLSPVLSSLHDGESLVFVPDGPLRALPFAALRNPYTGRYLIEEHVLAVAPSATLFVEELKRDSARSRVSHLDALVLGNPSFDRGLYPNLHDLPGSTVEAKAVAAVYGYAAELRLGSGASKRILLKNAGKHTVVHIASHALGNPDFPSLSRLLLAPSSGDDGSLFASEIEQSRFPATRLVVLAACGTSLGTPEGREGTQSLGWAFLAAGVPSVIASLWNVDDVGTGRLLTEFHRIFYATHDAPGSLRLAQLALLHGSNPAFRSPAVWASFELLGG
jgi:CHAT domain-containing protein